MKEAIELQDQIDKVKGKLEAEGISITDYYNAIECLKQTVAPKFCIRIYEEYIMYNL